MDLDAFKEYLKNSNKSKNTIKGYLLDVKNYNKWFQNSFDKEFEKLYRENILDYKQFLLVIKGLNAKTINHKLSSLNKYNEFLVSENIQKDFILSDNDFFKIQTNYVTFTNVAEKEVLQFLQNILESGNKRNYALVVLLAYSGLRISEALNLKMLDFDLVTGQCIVKNSKNKKQRIIYFNEKILNALKSYIKVRDVNKSDYLFYSNKNHQLSRITVNQIFNKYSTKITPHKLRHFFCTIALEKGGFSIHEVAAMAGHSDIRTTLIYTNPSENEIKKKINLL